MGEGIQIRECVPLKEETAIEPPVELRGLQGFPAAAYQRLLQRSLDQLDRLRHRNCGWWPGVRRRRRRAFLRSVQAECDAASAKHAPYRFDVSEVQVLPTDHEFTLDVTVDLDALQHGGSAST